MMQMNRNSKIGNAKFWIEKVGGNEILCCQFRNINREYKLDRNKVELYVETIVKLCHGKQMPFIIDLTDSLGTFSTEAASLLASTPELKRLRVYEAYVCNSIGMKLLVMSYKRIFEPTTPYAIFDDVETAKQYLIKN